ncbi:unnamed protein product [Hermetia illucens]|uniref:Uncharacterized protein n=1 Tax=Hermetia illucens TaxID=343691 RepID=A0A7R8UV87_HERIL|nr:unnamed protein product [Hermetia illucens]
MLTGISICPAIKLFVAELRHEVYSYLRLNQDVSENFYNIRSKDSLNYHPDQLQFKYRLQVYVMGHHEEAVSNLVNTDIDDTPDLDSVVTGNVLRSLTELLPLEKICHKMKILHSEIPSSE